MTTPGGVPNLPQGALTLDTLASQLQDMSGTAMKDRAVERFPSIMDNSTGLSPAFDWTPFGILTRIWAEINSLIANADPADIQGPEDLPGLFLDFIEGLPVVGQFVGILEAILGNYDGEDEVLLAIQEIFAPIRGIIDAIVNALTGGSGTGNDLSAILWALNPFNWLQQTVSAIQAALDPVLAQLAGVEGRLTAAEAALFNTGNPMQYDNFNRADIGPWTSVSGTLAITDNSRIQVQSGLAAGYIGVTGDVREPVSDKHGIHLKLVNQWDGVCRGFICSNADMSNYAAVEIRSSFLGVDSIRIVTGSSPSLVVAHRQIDFGPDWLGQGLVNGTVLSFKYDPDANTFYMLRNGASVPELTFPDVDGLVFHGPDKRKVGVVSNGDNSFGYTGFGITDFTYYDWT